MGIDTNSEVIELHNLLDVLVFLTERLELETIEEPYKQFLKLWSIKIIAYIHQRVNTILADEPLLLMLITTWLLFVCFVQITQTRSIYLLFGTNNQ